MAYFWISNGTTTLNLDDYVSSLEVGGLKRNFNVEDFAGTNGGYLKGIGNFSPRKLKFQKIERAEGTDGTAFNSRRNDFMAFFLKPFWEDWYFYIKDGEGTSTYRTLCYCTDIDSDKYKYVRISDDKKFEIILPNPVFESTTVNSTNVAITGSNEQTVTITVGGNTDANPIYSFTPTAAETSFQVSSSEGWKWRLDGTFALGVQISFNMGNGELTIGGAVVDLTSYLIAGSPFPLVCGTNTIYVKCSGAGTFNYSYSNRIV